MPRTRKEELSDSEVEIKIKKGQKHPLKKKLMKKKVPEEFIGKCILRNL